MSYVEEIRRKIGHDEFIGVGAGVFIYKDKKAFQAFLEIINYAV